MRRTGTRVAAMAVLVGAGAVFLARIRGRRWGVPNGASRCGPAPPATDGATVIVEDIEEYKARAKEGERLLEEARAARDRVNAILESITDAFVTVDQDWTVLYVNQEAERLFQKPRSELLGRNLWEVIPEAVGTRFEREFRKALAEQRTAAFEDYYAPLDVWLDVRAYPSEDRLSIYSRDITERKRVEEELQTRVRQLDALAELGQYALAETDLDRLFARAVEAVASAVGADNTELLELLPGGTDLLLRAGTGWREGLVGTATTSADEESMAGYTLLSAEPVIVEDLATETRFRGSWFLREHGAVSGLSVVVQGRERPWGALGAHSRTRRVFSGDDIIFLQSVSSILGQAIELRRIEQERIRLLEAERESRDESERARAESERRRRELERVAQSRDRLMRGFSHDVKNPLGAADGYLQLMEEGVLDELTPKQKEGVIRARRSIQDALNLIEDLLTIARAEAGTIQIGHEPTDLLALLRGVAENAQARAATKGLSLDVQLPGKLPTIESDPDRIRQVVGNLMSNAIKYTESGGDNDHRGAARRGCRARPGRGPRAGQVDRDRDHGHGAGDPRGEAAPHLPRVRPRRVGDAKEGQGIGLFISRRIAQALGGQVTVQSEVGRGSTFTLWLPLE